MAKEVLWEGVGLHPLHYCLQQTLQKYTNNSGNLRADDIPVLLEQSVSLVCKKMRVH